MSKCGEYFKIHVLLKKIKTYEYLQYLSLFTAGAKSTKYVGLFIYVYVTCTLEDFKTYQWAR